MARRILVEQSLEPVRIPGPVLHEIFAHARQCFPEECCGLLTGTAAERFLRSHPCTNEMTLMHQREPERYPRDNRHAFHMRDADYLRVMREAEARDERVNGVYHSHAGVEAYFSELDQEYARQELFPFPDADHLVVSVVDGQVKGAAAFRWLRDEGRFEGRRVEAAGP